MDYFVANYPNEPEYKVFYFRKVSELPRVMDVWVDLFQTRVCAIYHFPQLDASVALIHAGFLDSTLDKITRDYWMDCMGIEAIEAKIKESREVRST